MPAVFRSLDELNGAHKIFVRRSALALCGLNVVNDGTTLQQQRFNLLKLVHFVHLVCKLIAGHQESGN